MNLMYCLLISVMFYYSMSARRPGLQRGFVIWLVVPNKKLPDINSDSSCNIQMNRFTYKQPLLLEGSSLWRPTGPNFNVSGRIMLACTGSNNVLDGSGDSITQGNCTGNKLRYASKTLPAANVTCKTSISGDVRETTEKCANRQGIMLYLGFNLQDGTFIDLYSVCYSKNRADALYSHHTLFGRSVAFKQIEPRRPGFKTAGFATGVPVSKLYKNSAQQQMFSNLLGKVQAARYINERIGLILARGHLSPDADFPLVPLQFATYFYVNVCPQWQSVNAGNWLKVENMVRQLASRRKENFEIYTGIHNILTLPNKNGKNVELYLADQQKIRVPRWLWKVVYHRTKQEAIALITLNNPYAKTTPQLLCKDVCKKYNWFQNVFTVLAKGFTYCCDVNDLRKKVQIVPELNVTRILKFPER